MNKLIMSLLLFFFYSNYSMAGQYLLYFNSEPGDYIGQGQEALYTGTDLDFMVSKYSWDNSLHFTMNNFQRPGSFPYNWWGLDLSAPYHAPLSVGVYEEARRYPFRQEQEPGLWFSGNGRGCNRIYGRFEVKEAVYDSIGDVISFAVDFEQHCEQPDRPPVYGSLRYNSDVPIPTLVAPQIILKNSVNSQLCVEATSPDGATLEFSVESVQEDPSSLFEYEWSSSNGTFSNGKYFSFDLDLNMSAVVSVTLTDSVSGESATGTRSVCVSDTTPPTISIISPQEGQVFIGNNMMLDIIISDLVDKSIDKYVMFIGNERTIELDSATGISREKVSKPSPGSEPILTDIIIKARDAAGNEAEEGVEVYMRHDNRSK